VIDIRDLHLKRGRFALERVGLSVKEGECVVIVGPSGAGKTLLLEAILGIVRSDAGQVFVEGVDVTRKPLEQRGFSYVPQDLALFPHLGVLGNIAFALHPKRLTRAETSRRVCEVAAWLGISHLLERREVDSLSGGEKQRVALARAIVAQPRVLILDEPFSSLDSSTRHELYQAFAQLRQRVRSTVLMVTHNHDEALLFADRMAVLFNGSLIQVGRPQEVYRQPATQDVARLLLVENVLLGECLGKGQGPHLVKCRVGNAELEVEAPASCSLGERLWFGVRAQHVRTGHELSASAGRPSNRFSANIRRVSPRIDGLLLDLGLPLTAPGVPFLVAMGDPRDGALPEVGDTLMIEIPPERVIVGRIPGA
jgi:ABC-type sugar transport system ATPase subunit